MLLKEKVDFSGAQFIEEQNGAKIIKNVAMLGAVSSHGYEYEQPAMANAVRAGLYEGCRIFINHAQGGRDLRDLAGVFRNTRHEGGKVKGDAHLLSNDPGKLFWEIAKTMPEAASCSQVADGKLVTKGGKRAVEEISRVHSVDLVVAGATTRSVFEADTNPPAANTISIPQPAPKEKQYEFVARCIGAIKAENNAVPDDMASAACFTAWSARFESDSPEVTVVIPPVPESPETPTANTNTRTTEGGNEKPPERNTTMTLEQKMAERDAQVEQINRVCDPRYADLVIAEQREDRIAAHEQRCRDARRDKGQAATISEQALTAVRETDAEFEERCRTRRELREQTKRDAARIAEEVLPLTGALVE